MNEHTNPPIIKHVQQHLSDNAAFRLSGRMLDFATGLSFHLAIAETGGKYGDSLPIAANSTARPPGSPRPCALERDGQSVGQADVPVRLRSPAVPSGRPMPSASLNKVNFSSESPNNKSRKVGQRSSTGRTDTRLSSSPERCARTLDHAHSSARDTSRARTGFRLTYDTADFRCDSSMATDANRL